LFRHSWYENNEHPAFYWGRGAGWGLMAAAELLSVLPPDHPSRGPVLAIFQRGARGAASVQSGVGMWRQLLDKNDSYLETSASAMFTFAIARGVTAAGSLPLMRRWPKPAGKPFPSAFFPMAASRASASAPPPPTIRSTITIAPPTSAPCRATARS